ncbi:MAG: hypothetical protein O7G31_06670 [Calditrichaeota bacterium]|nr:hypothetical protein [Calditrichota bacterium]
MLKSYKEEFVHGKRVSKPRLLSCLFFVFLFSSWVLASEGDKSVPGLKQDASDFRPD